MFSSRPHFIISLSHDPIYQRTRSLSDMTDRRTPWTPAYTVALNQVPSDRQDAEKLAGEIWKAACVSYPAGPEPQLRTREPDSPASAPPSSEFHLFPRLPIELQDNIWKHAVRAVDPILLQSARWARWIPRVRLHYESCPAGDSSNKTVLVVGLPARMRSSPLYWACHAARRAAVAAYGDPAQGDIIFNPDVDYVQCAGDHDDPSQDFQQGFRLLYGAEDGDTLWLHHLRPYLNREVFHISRTAPDGKRARQLYWHSASAQDVVEDPPRPGPYRHRSGQPDLSLRRLAGLARARAPRLHQRAFLAPHQVFQRKPRLQRCPRAGCPRPRVRREEVPCHRDLNCPRSSHPGRPEP